MGDEGGGGLNLLVEIHASPEMPKAGLIVCTFDRVS